MTFIFAHSNTMMLTMRMQTHMVMTTDQLKSDSGKLRLTRKS